jgi:sulfur relay (sulfurtransferase) complex TusBCD TusD component (DsrE family)
MNCLLIRNDPPYGTERSYNGLRLANSLAKDERNSVSVFLMGDAAPAVFPARRPRMGTTTSSAC